MVAGLIFLVVVQSIPWDVVTGILVGFAVDAQTSHSEVVVTLEVQSPHSAVVVFAVLVLGSQSLHAAVLVFLVVVLGSHSLHSAVVVMGFFVFLWEVEVAQSSHSVVTGVGFQIGSP